jgi:hypothetical protein
VGTPDGIELEVRASSVSGWMDDLDDWQKVLGWGRECG